MYDSFAIPWTVAHNAPLFMKFPRQLYWSGLPFSSPGNLPDPGIKPASPAWQAFFITEPLGYRMMKTPDPSCCSYFWKETCRSKREKLKKMRSFLYDLKIYILNHYCTLALFQYNAQHSHFPVFPVQISALRNGFNGIW